MNTIRIPGYDDSLDEGIIVFNELSKRKSPMGKYHSTAVFPDWNGPVPEYGKSYYCSLRRDAKSNIIWATIQYEITLESILKLDPGIKQELADLILREYPDAFKTDIATQQIKDYENKIRDKYKTENSTLRSKIEHLENELSKLSEISRQELLITPDLADIGIENGLLHDEHLQDGEYSVRTDLNNTKALFIRSDGGEYYCTSGYIDISPLLKKFKIKKAVCKHCDELEGALVTFR